MSYKPTLRENGMVKQENTAFEPEGNGWPTPLVDAGPAVRQKITDGRNGEVNYVEQNATSQQKLGAHHSPEGKYAAKPNGIEAYHRNESDMPSLKDPLKTGQQILNEHHTPEGK